MSEDYECRKCYKKTVNIIKDYLETQCKEGESLEAEVYGGDDCYVSINYDIIINKKHISEYEHLPIDFLSEKFITPLIPSIMDSLLKQWRRGAQEEQGGVSE